MATEPGAGATGSAADDVALVDRLATAYAQLKDQLGKVIVGQDEVIEKLLIALFADGHCILEGVPGLAKTLLISTLARCLTLSFSRVQFTPDLMPADITGTEVIEEDKSTGTRSLRFVQGPVFANVVLADEINRTPPKTQAALLEAMQENGRSPPPARPIACLSRFMCWPPRTPSNRKAPIRCPRRSWTALCSRC